MAGGACTNRPRLCPGDEVDACGLRLETWRERSPLFPWESTSQHSLTIYRCAATLLHECGVAVCASGAIAWRSVRNARQQTTSTSLPARQRRLVYGYSGVLPAARSCLNVATWLLNVGVWEYAAHDRTAPTCPLAYPIAPALGLNESSYDSAMHAAYTVHLNTFNAPAVPATYHTQVPSCNVANSSRNCGSQ